VHARGTLSHTNGMSMITFFEDQGYRAFLPLTYSRPVYEMRCGIYTLRERVETLLGTPTQAICRRHIATVYGSGRWPLSLLADSAPLTLVNGRAVAVDWLPDLLHEPLNTIYVTEDDQLLGAHLSPSLASAVIFDLLHQEAGPALAELRRFARMVEVKTRMLEYPWDLIVLNGEQITRDVALLASVRGWPTAAERPPADPSVVVHNPSQVYLHPEARLDGPLVLDAREGPIVVAAAHVEPFSFIQGPTAIGAGSLIASARIRAETTIGPVCRVGGEVEASIIQGYSNKHHDGFLGHSYLGEWVNIGAMTTNSDLKNTYGSIRVMLTEHGQVDSGQMKLGCFLADHVKLGIGVHLNGGAVIGTGSNIFGVHFAPKTVPPFTWGGEVFREYRIERMIQVARKVMSRRKLTLLPEQETMLREVFAQTRGSRADMIEAPAAPAPGEAALTQAEMYVVQSYEAA
jgi:UDP-N-acetylglucosamine diphosphorylase/glucosamine-1-phosphate N-acetyltransferase